MKRTIEDRITGIEDMLEDGRSKITGLSSEDDRECLALWKGRRDAYMIVIRIIDNMIEDPESHPV